MTLYSCRTADGSFRITKFDNDLNPEASYLVSREACECPAGVRHTCRHRQMLPTFLNREDAIDSPLMLNWDTAQPFFVDTSSIADTTFEGLSERPLNPAVNELMDLTSERQMTEREHLEAHNAVAKAMGLEEVALPEIATYVELPEDITASEIAQRFAEFQGPLPGDSLVEEMVNKIHDALPPSFKRRV